MADQARTSKPTPPDVDVDIKPAGDGPLVPAAGPEEGDK